MKTVLFIVMFLLIGVFFIVSNENIHLNKSNETNKLVARYYLWAGDLFSNFKSISGYVIQSDWLPNDHLNGSVASKNVILNNSVAVNSTSHVLNKTDLPTNISSNNSK